jgi:ABC-type multidrug transport system fused ATPase/permease subunit
LKLEGGQRGRIDRAKEKETKRAELIKLTGPEADRQNEAAKSWKTAYDNAVALAEEAEGAAFNESDFNRVISFAGLEEFVNSLELRLNHKITRAGAELSGGQRQKIGIARAMLSTPDFLVLDESTSSLDTESEHVITNAIRNIQGKVTLIIISHRLTTIKNLDKIALVDNGKLVALDTFSNLEKNNTTFKNFIRLSQL